jgi:hypothetical protein
MGWPENEPVLGMHVRRGDAASSDKGTNVVATSTRRSFPLAAYLDAADLLCSRYGITHVYLSTESEDDVARAQAQRPQYRFLFVDHDRSMFPDITVSTRFIEYLALDEPRCARALAMSAIIDLFFFRQCHAFVGAFNSEFSVLAWLLTIGGRGSLVPYVSLSEPAAHKSLNPFTALLNIKNNCPLDLYHW